jgi:hypothetical protein
MFKGCSLATSEEILLESLWVSRVTSSLAGTEIAQFNLKLAFSGTRS